MKTYVVHKKFFIYCNRLCFMVYLWYISSNTEGNPNGGSCDMKFVRTEDLKAGMRLAKPIYNKKGVLLYERNSALTAPGIASAKNFGLIGVYILEPAEPLPPLSREDLEFEQLQTVYIFRLREVLNCITERRKLEKYPVFLEDILSHYGSLKHHVNFNQNLRSSDDFMYKHAISTAILVTMMGAHLRLPKEKLRILTTAALLYDNGYRNVPRNILEKGMNDLSSSDQDVIQLSLEKGLVPLSMYRNDFDFFPRALALMQTYVYEDHLEKLATAPDQELQEMASILRIADWFDRMTAMNSGHEPMSEIAAMQYFKKYPKKFLPVLVTALAECIHIIPKAASVDLSTGDKGIVLIENTRDFMRPVVLRLSDNQIYDLSDKNVYQEMQVTDIMKTMDNRVAMDEETLKQFVPDEKLRQLTQEFRRKLAAGKK